MGVLAGLGKHWHVVCCGSDLRMARLSGPQGCKNESRRQRQRPVVIGGLAPGRRPPWLPAPGQGTHPIARGGAQGIDHLEGSLGLVAKDVVPLLEPGHGFRAALAEGGIGRRLQMLNRMPAMPNSA